MEGDKMKSKTYKAKCFFVMAQILLMTLFSSTLAKKWTEPKAITDGKSRDEYPTISADRKGNIWIAWCSDRDGDNNIYARRWNGKRWSKPIPITKDKGDDYSPDMVVDKKGNLWVTWVTNRNGNYDIYARYYDGHNWSKPMPVTTFEEDDMHPAIAVDRQDRIWITWYTWLPYKGVSRDRDVFVSYYDGEIWSERVRVNPLKPEVEDHTDPDICIDGLGNVWISWSWDYHPVAYEKPKCARGCKIFARSYDGRNWSEEMLVSIKERETTDFFPAIVTDKNGRVWVVWESYESDKSRDIFINYYDSKSWSTPIQITKDKSSDCDPSIIVDNKGMIWIFWQTDRDGDWNIYESHYDGTSWSKPAMVTGKKIDDHYPSLALDKDGNIWLTWYGQKNGMSQIFYARWKR